MADRPILHLTNWSSRSLHGPGRRLSIMARPRAWEWGDGRVGLLVPDALDLVEHQEGRMSLDRYRERFLARVRRDARDGLLAPGILTWTDGTSLSGPVLDGDSLLCACSRADAAAGRCHRAWAAPWLVRAGWRVILDGVEVPRG